VTKDKRPLWVWPTEAAQTALERGDIADWHRITAEVRADPWGKTARQVEEVLSHSRPYGIAEAMEIVLSRASAPAHPDSTLSASDWARLDLADLGPDLAVSQLPESFRAFASSRELRQRIRSVTGCYFDLADHVVEVPGGQLVHFLSDSQWVRH
jgi:hypothetical protein